jgi:hypothetical protein
MHIWELITGGAEFFAWIAMIYTLASDEAGRAFFALLGWAERMEAKYRG